MAAEVASDGQVDHVGARVALTPRFEVVGSTALLSFFVRGTPTPKGRPRFGKDKYGRPRTYTPQDTVDWENQVGWEARAAINRLSGRATDDGELRLPFEERVLSELTFYMPKPKSYPKSMVHMTKKPDLDNLSKAVLDALSKAKVIKDDNIVTDEVNRKRYAEVEGVPTGVHVTLTGWL